MNKPCARITLDLQQASTPTFVAVKKSDIGREIRITLSDGGFPYEISADCYAVLTGTKPDGNILYNHCDIEGNTIVYEITEQTTAAAGRMKAEVKLYGADDVLVTSATFRIIIDGTVYTDDKVESSSEFSALNQLMDQVLEVIRKNPGEGGGISVSIVNALPTEGIDTRTLYLVKNADTPSNIYAEYMYVNGEWEIIGSQQMDVELAGYATEQYVKDYAQPKGNYLTEHQDISGKLDANKLPDAVNDALAQAKESGAFDGEDGNDYVLTDDDKDEIAGIAADLVEVSGTDNYPDWSHLKWYVMGDSLTAQDNDFTDKRYYDFVQEKTDIQVIVDGIGATGYKTGENEGKSYLDRVKNIPEDVDIVTIFGSGNDLKSDDTEYANTAIWETLRWLVLNRPGLRVVVVPPAPWRNFDKRGEVWKAYCDRLQTCALACDFRYVSDMYDCPPFNGKHDSHMEKFFTTDPNGVHPNELGHEALAPFFYNALSQELALKAVGGNADLNELINNALAAMPNAAEVAY